MLGITELALLGFAAARGTQLIVHDSILDGPRERLEIWHAAKESKARDFFRTLAGCSYCAGWHLSWVTLLAYLYATGQADTLLTGRGFLLFGLQAFAVAGFQMLVNRYDDTLNARPVADAKGRNVTHLILRYAVPFALGAVVVYLLAGAA